MACRDFKDLNRRTAADKVFNIAKNPKYDGYHCRLASMVYKSFDKKTPGGKLKMKLFLKKNQDIRITQTNQNIRTLKNKLYKHMTSSTKSTFIDKLDDRVNKHNNTFYSTIKMKPIDVRSNKYIDSSK